MSVGVRDTGEERARPNTECVSDETVKIAGNAVSLKLATGTATSIALLAKGIDVWIPCAQLSL
jgi:hypothetical protein